jgi:hypothetical protein
VYQRLDTRPHARPRISLLPVAMPPQVWGRCGSAAGVGLWWVAHERTHGHTDTHTRTRATKAKSRGVARRGLGDSLGLVEVRCIAEGFGLDLGRAHMHTEYDRGRMPEDAFLSSALRSSGHNAALALKRLLSRPPVTASEYTRASSAGSDRGMHMCVLLRSVYARTELR